MSKKRKSIVKYGFAGMLWFGFCCGLSSAASLPDVATMKPVSSSLQYRYMVRLHDLPVALYDGAIEGLPALKRSENGRLNIETLESEAYAAYLEKVQQQVLSVIEKQLGRVSDAANLQYAFNGFVMKLTAQEAKDLKKLPYIADIQQEQFYVLSSDVGPGFMGAPSVWAGGAAMRAAPGLGRRSMGEGKVIGVLDTGLNLGSPSFAAVDRFSGVAPIYNPFEHPQYARGEYGPYFGLCRTQPNLCNAKVIGGWDLIADADLPSGSYDAPGFEDEDGHGSHVASIAAGNFRTGRVGGLGFEMSGIAPRANLMIYNVCYTNSPGVTMNRGTCPGSAVLRGIEQVIRDQIIDVVNLSFDGGAYPWQDNISLALLAAQSAGVIVIAAAGNARSEDAAPGNVMHQAPWVTTVGAISHSRGNIQDIEISLTGPSNPTNAVRHLRVSPGSAGTRLAQNLAADTPLIISPGFLNRAEVVSDGCAPYAADTFKRGRQSAIALIKRGTCTFAVKARHAQFAGAAMAVIANDDILAPDEYITPVLEFNETPADIPVLGLSLADALSIRTYAWDRNLEGLTAEFSYSSDVSAATPSVIAKFSNQGPSNDYGLIKPDIVAPGVDILGSLARWQRGLPGQVQPSQNERIGVLSGTSMASAFIAGSAILLRDLFPIWSPSQLRSALVLSAYSRPIMLPDGQETHPFHRGNGMVLLDGAARTGLSMNEWSANYRAADRMHSGQPENLNVPSLQAICAQRVCTYTREVQSVNDRPIEWTVRVEGIEDGSVIVSPRRFTLNAERRRQMIEINLVSALLSANAYKAGEIIFEPAYGGSEFTALRMPIAVRKPVEPE